MTAQLDRGWVRIGWILLAIAIVALVHHETVATMVAMWGEEHHTQSYLVPPLFAYLLWSSRQELAAAPPGSGWPGVIGAVVLTLLWLMSEAIALQLGVFITVVLLASALACAFIGWPAYRTVWFPLAFWLASVPMGSEFIPALMNFTADISEFLLKLTGVTFYRQAKVFELPGGTFQVAEVCAGLRYLSASVTLAVLYCYLNYRAWWRWVLFVGVTVVAFILANGLRAAITMWVSSETSLHDFTGPAHVWMGRALFFLTIVGLFWFGKRFSDLPDRPAESRAADDDGRRVGIAIASGIIGVALVVGAPGLASMRSHAATLDAARVVAPEVAGCSHLEEWPASWTPEFHGPDHVLATGYDCGGVTVGLYVATYVAQTQGKELVSEGNRLLPVGKKEVAETDADRFDDAHGVRVDVDAVRFDTGLSSGIAWTWYSVGDHAELSGAVVKLRQALDALLFRQSPASAYVVFADDTLQSDPRPAMARVAAAAWAARTE